MFKVLKDTPPIPETLSPEGKDFLRCCFRRNPAERPSATMLLEHPFMRVFHQPDVPSFLKPVGGMRVKVSTFNSSLLLFFFSFVLLWFVSCDRQCNNITFTGKVEFSKRAHNIQSWPKAFIAREVALKRTVNEVKIRFQMMDCLREHIHEMGISSCLDTWSSVQLGQASCASLKFQLNIGASWFRSFNSYGPVHS